MKLLFDANLSPKLVGRLAELFPESIHIFQTELAKFTPDQAIWEYARVHEYTIVTADSDFLALSQSLGPPPRVVHIEHCSYRTSQVEAMIRRNAVLIAELEHSEHAVLSIRTL